MTIEYPKLHLKSGRDFSARRGHPWIFSGAVEKLPKGLSSPLVSVYDAAGEPVGVGLFSAEGSIAVKMLTSEIRAIDQSFFAERIAQAYAHRRLLHLTDSDRTNAYRLVNAEGDSLPGLIVDFYAGVCVVQIQQAALLSFVDEIKWALESVVHPSAVYLKSYADENESRYLLGTPSAGEMLENGYRFVVDWERGQKTGFFLDQRENRKLLESYSSGRTVLNAFCYTGGFSVYALGGGASRVVSLDSSKPALRALEENLTLNFENPRHENVADDFFRYMQTLPESFDLIILDPPAFGKDRRSVPAALKGYRNINAAAFKALPPGGLLFTFSCSQLVSREDFRSAVFEGAVSAGRTARVLRQLHQAPCHPVRLSHPEGDYLKGLVLAVD